MILYDFWLFYWLSVLTAPLFGLIPLTVGRNRNKRGSALFGFLCTCAGGLLFMAVPTAIGFVIAIKSCRRDFAHWMCRTPAPQPPAAPASPSYSLAVSCLSGPMKGRSYLIGDRGILFGRNPDCAIRFDDQTPGISRHHCDLRWQQNTLMLTDLNSAYGTYLSDGRKLPPQYPTALGVGSRFYLADQQNLFQIVIST